MQRESKFPNTSEFFLARILGNGEAELEALHTRHFLRAAPQWPPQGPTLDFRPLYV